jgi:uncharacterized protein (TIGR02996 family)
MARTREAELFAAVAADPSDRSARMVYADWLEEAGDPRCGFIRQHLRVAPLSPDHPGRLAGEEELSRERVGIDPTWLAVIEPERSHHYLDGHPHECDCLTPQAREDDEQDAELNAEPRRWAWREVELHREPQDTECEGWLRLLEYIERLAAAGAATFRLGDALSGGQWREIVTLPPTIAKLTSVTTMTLYGSRLVRIPPEIGAMTRLRSFTPYTSYRLHWFPYEIMRCGALVDSTVSTRALYGNFKFRPPFPQLLPPTPIELGPRRPCSVCDRQFEDLQRFRVWISLRVATDVLPLLVNACSAECVRRLPAPPDEYLPDPHRGGVDLEQPRPQY